MNVKMKGVRIEGIEWFSVWFIGDEEKYYAAVTVCEDLMIHIAGYKTLAEATDCMIELVAIHLDSEIRYEDLPPRRNFGKNGCKLKVDGKTMGDVWRKYDARGLWCCNNKNGPIEIYKSRLWAIRALINHNLDRIHGITC
jgi:hypothetical protein